MKNILLALSFAALLTNAAFATNATLAPTACDGLAGSTFVSLQKYEMGRGPDGVVYGNRTIEFGKTDASYSYRLSDFGLSGKFVCEGKEAHVSTDTKNLEGLNGAYNRESGLLYFHGIWFKKSI